jgi:mitochondrial Rho GTPase 1
VQVATHGENTGYEVPCLIVAAKDDLDQSSQALQESTRVSFLTVNYVDIVEPR